MYSSKFKTFKFSTMSSAFIQKLCGIALTHTTSTLLINKPYTADEMLTIKQKLNPKNMPFRLANQWAMFSRKNHLYIHHHGMGSCIYIIEFAKVNNAWYLTKALANRHSDEYKVEDETFDAFNVVSVIGDLLFNKDDISLRENLIKETWLINNGAQE